MRPSSISIVSIDGYFSEILTYFGTGLFNYCTCGHCGWEIIVCPSVGSCQYIYFISILFFHIDSHCWIGMDHIGVILACWFIMVLIYGVNSSVCLSIGGNLVSFNTELNSLIILDQLTIFLGCCDPVFFHSNHIFWLLSNHIFLFLWRLLPLATISLSYQ